MLSAGALALAGACGGDTHASTTDPANGVDAGPPPPLNQGPSDPSKPPSSVPSNDPQRAGACQTSADCSAAVHSSEDEGCLESYCDLDDHSCKLRACRGDGPARSMQQDGYKRLTYGELAQLGVDLTPAGGAPLDPTAPSGFSLIEMPTSIANSEDGADLGKGFDTVLMRPRGWCVKNDKVRTLPAAQNTRWNMFSVETVEQFKSVLNISASAAFSAGIYGGDASLSFLQASSRSRYGLFLVTRVDVDNPGEQLAEYKLTDEVLNGLQRSSFDFRQTCGDSFVMGRVTGGTFIGTLDIDVETEEEKSELMTKFGLQYGSIAKVSAEVNAKFEAFLKSTSIRASIIRQGGAGRLLPTGEVSIDKLREASLNFPDLVNQNGGTPWVKRYLLADYGVIADRPSIPPIVDAMRRQVLAELDRLWNRLWQMRKDADYVLANPTQFVNPDLDAAKRVSAQAGQALDQVVAAAAACFQDAAQCHLIDVDLSWSATRVPSCKTDVARDCPVAYTITGACKAGRQSCKPDGTWNACEGAVVPQPRDSCSEDLTCDGKNDNAKPVCGCGGDSQCQTDGNWSACSEPSQDCGECGRRTCPGGQAWSACVPAADRACSHGRACGSDGNCLPHRFELALENVDDDAYVWSANNDGADPRNALLEVHRTKDGRGSRGPWQLPSSGRYVVRFGNGGCFDSSGTVKLLMDGQEVQSFSQSSRWRACGWFYRLIFDVDFTTGAVDVIRNDGCEGLPTDGCKDG